MTAFDDVVRSGNPRIGIFLRLGIEPPARLWMGVGDCEAGIDAEDEGGAIYKGLGTVIDVPVFQQLINGAAERVDLRLSGVDERAVQLAASEADDVKGVPLLMGIGVFDEEWQLAGNPTWLRRMVVDFLTLEQQPAAARSKDGAVRTIALSARSFLTGRRRPAVAFYTDSDQQARSPGDRFCERTGLYAQEVVKTWPIF